jgi:hypothetical protein
LFWLSNKSCFPSTPILSSVLVPYFASNTNWQDTLIGGQVGGLQITSLWIALAPACVPFPPKTKSMLTFFLYNSTQHFQSQSLYCINWITFHKASKLLLYWC